MTSKRSAYFDLTPALMRSSVFSSVLAVSLFSRLCRTSSFNYDFSEIPEFNMSENERPFIIVPSTSSEVQSICVPAPMANNVSSTTSMSIPPIETNIPLLASETSLIQKPKKTARSISELFEPAPATPKRKKPYPNHYALKSIEQIIDEEVAHSGFKAGERLSQFRKTLTLISINDHISFIDDQVNFKRVFGAYYHSFKKDKEETIFLYRYFILFGATNLLPAISKAKFIFDESLYSAFNYLLDTKPFTEVLKVFLWHRVINFTAESREMVQAALLARCPESCGIKKSMIKLIGKAYFFHYYNAVIDAPESLDSLDKIIDISKTLKCISSTPVIIRTIIKDNPVYYRDTNRKKKFTILKEVLIDDDLELLINLLNLDNEMVLYIDESNSPRLYNEENSNILIEAIAFRAVKCLDFLVGTFPELATASNEKLGSPINFLIKNSCFKECFEIFERYGFDANYITKIDGNEMNLLQASIHSNNYEAISYYSRRGESTVGIGKDNSVFPNNP